MSETLIPNLPPSFQQAKGVVMAPPPAKYLEQTTSVIRDALKTLEKDEKAAIAWIATTKDDKINVNLAFVQRVNDNFEVVGWVGKQGSWGAPIEAGIAGRVHW